MKSQLYSPVKDPIFQSRESFLHDIDLLNPFDEPLPSCLWLDGRDPASSHLLSRRDRPPTGS